ncbi:hypothetical protein WAI453_007222 [Rhynchosporium graminicola]
MATIPSGKIAETWDTVRMTRTLAAVKRREPNVVGATQARKCISGEGRIRIDIFDDFAKVTIRYQLHCDLAIPSHGHEWDGAMNAFKAISLLVDSGSRLSGEWTEREIERATDEFVVAGLIQERGLFGSPRNPRCRRRGVLQPGKASRTKCDFMNRKYINVTKRFQDST